MMLATTKPLLVIGLGNPLLSDDGVGLAVARLIEEARMPGVEVAYAHSGGLDLMELMVGYDQAVVIDALDTSYVPCPAGAPLAPGQVVEMQGTNLESTRNAASSHSATLGEALEAARALGIEVPGPGKVRLFGIQAHDVITVSESLTSELTEALPEALAAITSALALNIEEAACRP